MTHSLKLYCCMAVLPFFFLGCASHKQEERLVALESQAAGQHVLDMRLARVEDRLTHVEQRLDEGGLSGKKIEKGAKKTTDPAYTPAVPARATTPHPAETKGPRFIDPAPSLASINKTKKTAEAATDVPGTAMSPAVAAALAEAEDIAPKKVITTTAKSGAVSVAPTTQKAPAAKDARVTALADPLPPQPQEAGKSAGTAGQAGAVASMEDRFFSFSSGLEAEERLMAATGQPLMTAATGSQAVEPRKITPEEPKTSAAQTSAKAPSQGKTGNAAYDAALAAYEKGQHKSALEQFEAFLQANPKSSLAANALYWQGECYYSMGQHTAAIMKFKDVVAKYPKHAKAAAAMLKIGFAYAKLNDMENAKFYWEILLEDFPGSQPAAIAKKRLAALPS